MSRISREVNYELPPLAEFVDIIKLMGWDKISMLEDAIKSAKEKGATHFCIAIENFKDFDYDKNGIEFVKILSEPFNIHLEEQKLADDRSLQRISERDPLIKLNKTRQT